MGFFKKLKKKNQFMLDDPYTVRLEFDDEFAPENNDEIRKIIEQVSESEENENVAPLNQTLPFATFKTAEDLFDELRTLAATTAKPVTFSYFAIWEFDKTQKAKVGKKGSADGNPHEFITLSNFSIDYDYQNLTKSIFEEIFNDPSNSDVDYDEKINYCEELKAAYQDSTGTTDNNIAILPTEEDIQKGRVTLSIPALENIEKTENDSASKAPVYDPVSGKFSEAVPMNNNQKVSQTTNSNQGDLSNSYPENTSQTVMIKKSNPKEQVIQNHNDKPSAKKMDTYNSRKEKHSVEEKVTKTIEDVRNKGYVEAPKFAVEVLDPVEPGHKGYVEYQVNQKKKTLNKVLEQAANKLNSSNEKYLLGRRNIYAQNIQEKLAEYNKLHANDAATIHDEVEKSIQNEYNQALTKKNEEIDNQANADKAEAKRSYEKTLEQIDESARTQKKMAQQELDKEFNGKALESYDRVWKDHEKQVNENEKKLEAELNRHYEIQAQEDASQVRAHATELLQELLKKCSKELDITRTNVTNEDLNARQTIIAHNRSQAELKRIEYPHEKLEQKDKTISDLNARLSTSEAARNANNKDVISLKHELKSRDSKIESLRKEIELLKQENTNKRIEQSNKENSKNVNDIMQLVLAQSLQKMNQPQSVTIQTPQTNPSAPKPSEAEEKTDNQVASMVKGVKRMVIGFIVTLLLIVVGIAGYTAYQKHQHQQEVTQLQQQMHDRVEAAKKLSTVSQDQINSKAVAALHSNNANELDKYKTETYYNLDKAIIANDPKQANDAIQKMNNLDMNDRYRASQAQSLLTKANNNQLADKVAQANK